MGAELESDGPQPPAQAIAVHSSSDSAADGVANPGSAPRFVSHKGYRDRPSTYPARRPAQGLERRPIGDAPRPARCHRPVDGITQTAGVGPSSAGPGRSLGRHVSTYGDETHDFWPACGCSAGTCASPWPPLRLTLDGLGLVGRLGVGPWRPPRPAQHSLADAGSPSSGGRAQAASGVVVDKHPPSCPCWRSHRETPPTSWCYGACSGGTPRRCRAWLSFPRASALIGGQAPPGKRNPHDLSTVVDLPVEIG